MRALAWLSGAGSAAMFALIAKASLDGHFMAEGSVLYALWWGKVTLADLYAGFFLMCGWILFREQRLARALLFVLLVMSLGNAFTLAYVAVALARSGGSATRFFLGARHRAAKEAATQGGVT
jgi:hypothetical protein